MSSPYDINILKKVDFVNLFTFTVVRHLLVDFGFLCLLDTIQTQFREQQDFPCEILFHFGVFLLAVIGRILSFAFLPHFVRRKKKRESKAPLMAMAGMWKWEVRSTSITTGISESHKTQVCDSTNQHLSKTKISILGKLFN